MEEEYGEGVGADAFRHQCLVRWVIRWRLKDRNAAHDWIVLWNSKHPGSILERDVKDQWQKGNRGIHPVWM